MYPSITLSRQAKFKGIVEKNGFKFESGRIMVPGEDGVATPAGNPSGSTSVKTPKTPKTPKSAATTGKRKASAITGDVATETPTKSAAKKKKAPIKNEVEVKSEEDDDDVDANDDAGMSATADGAVKASSAKKNKKKPIAATANGNPIKKEVAGEIAGLGLEIIAEEVAKDSESDDDDDSSEIMIVGDLSA